MSTVIVSSVPEAGQHESRRPAPLPLVRVAELQYEGAFRLPEGKFGGSSFGYGGTALAHNPTRHSLFMVGHDWHQQVAEVSIPPLVVSSNPHDLRIASVLQPFVDPSEGLMQGIDDGEVKIGGLLVHEGELYGTAYSYYDADGSATLSHFVRPTDLSRRGSVRGMYQVGKLGAGVVAGWIVPVPAVWQRTLGGAALTGQCCIAIISRSSFGPAVFAFNPWDLGVKHPVPSIPLVYHPEDHVLAEWSATSPLYNGATQMAGAIFPEGTRSVLFFGVHGTGKFCYGTGAECGDPVFEAKASHAYPYVDQVWAYDAEELAAVRKGLKKPWDVRPYEVGRLSLPFKEFGVNGVTYDPATRRVYLSQRKVVGDEPVIHALKITIPGK